MCTLLQLQSPQPNNHSIANILIGTTVAFLSMRIANNAKKVTGAVNTSNEHTKVVADLYISRMPRLKAAKCQCNNPEQAAT